MCLGYDGLCSGFLPCMGVWPLCVLYKKKEGFRFVFLFGEKERPSIADCFILIEKKVGRLSLTHHKNCFGSCDPILNGIGLDPF